MEKYKDRCSHRMFVTPGDGKGEKGKLKGDYELSAE